MTLMNVIFTATALGRAHRHCGRGTQDAASLVASPDGRVAAAAVADGCSAGARSEVGAGLGARFVCAAAVRRVRAGVPLAELPHVVIADLVDELAHLARALDGGDLARVIEEHLLFTVHAIVVAADEGVVFGVGDGVVSIDGHARVIDQGAAPDYPAYALFPSMAAPRVLVHHLGPFASAAVATDGAHEVLADLAAFEREERFVRNPSLAQKRMRAWCDTGGGPVDDCTIAVVRTAPPLDELLVRP